MFSLKKSDVRECTKSARKVSLLTGESFFYHWLDCLYCIVRHGCSPTQYIKGGFFKLRSFDRKNTYTKGRGFKMKKNFNNSHYTHFFSNKVEFNKCFADYIKRDWLYVLESSSEELLAFLNKNDRIIVKPIGSTKGIGIYILDRNIADEEIIKEIYGKDYLLESFIEQHSQISFGAKSVNTIRINTIVDSKGEVHILKAGLRCGVGDSIVDNYSAGGVVYPINIEYGRIEGVGINKTIEDRIYVHPGTNIFMIGREIPFWQELIIMVEKAAKKIPQVRFVGWDVAITNNGPVIIEGNTRPGASLIEYQGEKRGFYKQMLLYK